MIMIDINYLKRLLKAFDDSSATDLHIEEEGVKLKMSKRTGESGHSSIVYSAAPSMPAPVFPPSVQPTALPEAQSPELKPAAEVSAETKVSGNLHEVKSPIVGTFYRSPSPDSDPFVEIGTHVKAGTTLCIVEAMKLMNEIESDTTGIIEKILIENGKPVEYNQPLFIIKPD
jgi:acetyl-CoA carboxylase biotin carboxyl carrier protein